MLQQIDAAKARNNFSELLGQVYYGGKRFLIKRMGKPCAVLIDANEYARFEQARKDLADQIKENRKGNGRVAEGKVETDVARAIKAVRVAKIK